MKDAFWQIAWRMISAFSGFFIVIIMTPLLGPLRYGDYTTILSYFALWSALSDLWLYVIGLKDIGKLKAKFGINTPADLASITPDQKEAFSFEISQFVWARIGQIVIVYTIAILVAYLIPSYASNPYIARWLPLGMLFSAGFMLAGIIQLPLQLFRKMEQVSIALVLARVAQLAMLWIIIAGNFWWPIDSQSVPMGLFLLMIGSVTLSSIVQTVYTLRRSNKIIKLRYVPFRKPMLRHIRDNGKYGMAFFLSSFHTLLVTLIISIMYPTIDGFVYAGIWWLALQLIQILLIIPAAIANSLIHGISSLTKEFQKISFWHLLNILILFGWICVANFFVFSTPIIRLLSGEKYLTQGNGFSFQWLKQVIYNGSRNNLGTDFILPWLGIVLALSFVKTVFNYVFVAANRQNTLFPINLFGISIGVFLALFSVYYYNLLGGIVAQLLMEVLFVAWSVYYAKRYDIMPKISFWRQRWVHVFFIVLIGLLRWRGWGNNLTTLQVIVFIVLLNASIVILRRKFILQEFKSITLSMQSIETKI